MTSLQYPTAYTVHTFLSATPLHRLPPHYASSITVVVTRGVSSTIQTIKKNKALQKHQHGSHTRHEYIINNNVLSSTHPRTSRELLTACDFDVTGVKYGGKPDYDITEALANAWKDACASTSASKVLVPNGTYKLKEASFKGPCKAPIELQVQGTLEAPQASAQLSKPDTWIEFSNLDNFTLLGGGTFDGQGQKAWLANDCHKNSKCTSIAIAPSKVKISNVSFKNIRGTSSTPVAVKIACATGLPCEKVEMTDIDLKYSGNEGSITSQCSNVKPTVTRVANTLACATKP
uniref:polygalacturonase-like n=1 Tax=Fragaria vesca subsp. vesca TaxID=101020 RepID=UPI0005C87159|nr:PREDICTED: polygalacturonase-like [Fragaria vesca subsp. vesca]